MKSEFKTKLIQHMLNKKNGEKGFTLIELLVVIIIIGILAAIALPSFLNQAAKARQSEAKTYTGSVIKAQEAYYLEKQSYAPTFTDLGKEQATIKTQTDNYTYTISGSARGLTGTAANGFVAGTPRVANLKAYAGLSQLVNNNNSNSNLSVLCESTNTTTTAPDLDSFTRTDATAPVCNNGAGYTGII
jgi:prepilin-type N-terminal cleavage/methylation domain-containing protein